MTTTKQMTLEHAWRLGFIESAKWNGVCTQDADSLAAITAMKMDLGNAHLAKGAQVPDGFIVVPMPNPEEMEALRSFAATAGDDESYTVSRELMSRLLLFGAVYRSTKRDWYYLTDFGRCLLAAAPMLSQRGEVES